MTAATYELASVAWWAIRPLAVWHFHDLAARGVVVLAEHALKGDR